MEEDIKINGQLYTEIDEKYFLRGMFCTSDVYGVIKGHSPLLLCSKTVINDKFYKRLKHLHDEGKKIYINADSIESIKDQYEHLSNNNREYARKLQQIREEFKDVIGSAITDRKVSMDIIFPMVDTLDMTIKEIDLAFILHWSSYLRDMDEYLQTHSINVAIFSGKLAEWLGMNKEQIHKAVMIGLLHDLGKTQVPPEILNKPGRLTPGEFEVIKLHPLYSWGIVKKSGVTDEEILAGVRGHHEKVNGTGYPDGLSFHEISDYAKITEIADIYDAMVAQRVYKESRTPFEVLDEFYKEKYAELDLHMVEVFLDKMRTGLIGKEVILSNGRIGKIVFIEEGRYRYPLVETDNKVIQLSDSIQCVTLCTHTGII